MTRFAEVPNSYPGHRGGAWKNMPQNLGDACRVSGHHDIDEVQFLSVVDGLTNNETGRAGSSEAKKAKKGVCAWGRGEKTDEKKLEKTRKRKCLGM